MLGEVLFVCVPSYSRDHEGYVKEIFGKESVNNKGNDHHCDSEATAM